MATHLSRHLHAAGHRIDCIWSRDRLKAAALSAVRGGRGTDDHAAVPADSDFYILALTDRIVPEVADLHRGASGIWLHTAGSVPMEVLGGCFNHFGVLYPLQTISAERELSLEDTPFLVEGSDPEVTEKILTLARTISSTVTEMDSTRRLVVHLAAVFANNFSNHMMLVADRILREHSLDPSLLEPLVRETFARLKEAGPESARTGPALRGDQLTMEKHLELLKSHPEWQKLYTFVSRDIARSRDISKKDP